MIVSACASQLYSKRESSYIRVRREMASSATPGWLPRDVAQCSRGSVGTKRSNLRLRHRSTQLLNLLFALCCATLPALGGAVDDATPEITIPRVTRAPKLVDFLKGTPREAEAKVTEF